MIIQAIKKYLQRIPFFIIMIPLFILIHVEREYHHLIVYRFVYKEMAWLVTAPFIILAACYLFARDWKKSCMYCLVLMLPFYFFCDLKDGLDQLARNYFINRYIFLIPVVTFLIIFLLRLIQKSTSSFKKSFFFFNCLFGFFIVADVTAIYFSQYLKKTEGNISSNGILKKYKPCIDCTRPDIYFIIFDAYTSSPVLQSEFGFNNKRIDSFLVNKGFYLVPNSTSNYNLTPFSIASCFDLDYLNQLDTHKDFFMKEYFSGISGVRNNLLIQLLEKEGYEIINHSIFNFKDHPPTVQPFDLWDQYSLYQRHNIFHKIDSDIGWNIRIRFKSGFKSERFDKYVSERDNHVTNVYRNSLLTTRGQSSKPRFIYSHFMIPHPPYSFDSTGNKIKEPMFSQNLADDKKSYISQLIFSNKIIMDLVDNILSNSKRPSVIILQGDHGYKYLNKSKNSLEFNNLNAIYFYNKDYHLLRRDISMVNTFRIVMNTFFDQKFTLLKDTSYFLQYK